MVAESRTRTLGPKLISTATISVCLQAESYARVKKIRIGKHVCETDAQNASTLCCSIAAYIYFNYCSLTIFQYFQFHDRQNSYTYLALAVHVARVCCSYNFPQQKTKIFHVVHQTKPFMLIVLLCHPCKLQSSLLLSGVSLRMKMKLHSYTLYTHRLI